MSIPNYRMLLSFDSSQNVFRARSPELEHCFGEGATRAEAISKLEQEIQAQLHNMKDQGKSPPRSVDDQEWNGEVTAHVSKVLHRDLVWQARLEGVELTQLLSEILSAGLENRKQSGRSGRAPSRNQHDENRGTGGNRHERGHNNYPAGLDDRANFIQYVRGIESESNRDAGPRGKDRPRGPNRPHQNNNKRRHGGGNGAGRRQGQGQGGQGQGRGDNRQHTAPAQGSSGPSEAAMASHDATPGNQKPSSHPATSES